jgi:uncharacterized membrane protein (DUF485 family)
MAKVKKEDILNDPDFLSLVSRRNRIAWILTILELVLYFGFISLVAFNKPFLGMKLTGAITIGIPIAVGTILLSWVFTGVYIRWANQTYDTLVNNIKEKIGG